MVLLAWSQFLCGGGDIKLARKLMIEGGLVDKVLIDLV